MNRYMLQNEVETLLSKPVFSKEDASRADVMLRYLDRADPGNGALPQKRTNEIREFFQHQERRDMITSTGGTPATVTADGAFVPTGFFGQVFAALKSYDGLFDACTWISSKNGARFALPSFYDADTKAEKISEADVSHTRDVNPISALVLDAASTWRSGMIRFSYELLQDQRVNLDGEFAKAFAIRFSRGIGADLVSTLVSQAPDWGGTVVGDNNASSPDPSTEVGYLDLVNLVGSVDPLYSQSAGAGWLMTLSTLLYLYSLTDQHGYPLIQPANDANGRPLLLTKPVYICPSMDSLGSGNTPIAYGALDRFVCREVAGSFQVKQFVEMFAEYGQNATEAYWRVNGGLLIAGGTTDKPVVKLVNAS